MNCLGGDDGDTDARVAAKRQTGWTMKTMLAKVPWLEVALVATSLSLVFQLFPAVGTAAPRPPRYSELVPDDLVCRQCGIRRGAPRRPLHADGPGDWMV